MQVSTDKNAIKNLLDRRVSEDGFFPQRDEIEKKLLSGDGLRFYYGIDPTGKSIHLGHTLQLLLLKGLAELGHQIVLLIGDFTAKVGDPTGKDKTRVPLEDKEIKENMRNYLEQISHILPKGSFGVKYNSEWLRKMDMVEILELTSQATVQQMITRDMFQERLKQEKPIGINEFLYPLMQGYDSVAMGIDGEVGGHDQIFNMLVGRDLVKKYLDKDKIVLATKLIVDPSTGKKMSKSDGETVALDDEPAEIRRKILATNDSMTKNIFKLCTEEELGWINEKSKELDGRAFKELLADKLVELYHGKDKVEEARKSKELEFSQVEGKNLAETIKISGFTSSVSTGKELINSGAVSVMGEVKQDWHYEPKRGDKIQVGKGKFLEIK